MHKNLSGGTMTPFGWWESTTSPTNFDVDSSGNITAGGSYTWSQVENLTKNLGTSNLLDTLANFGSNAFSLANSIINSETAKNATDLYSKITGQSNKVDTSSYAQNMNSLYENIAQTVKKNQKMIIYGLGGIAAILIISRIIRNKKDK